MGTLDARLSGCVAQRQTPGTFQVDLLTRPTEVYRLLGFRWNANFTCNRTLGFISTFDPVLF